MNILQKTIVDAVAQNVERTRAARQAHRCHYVKVNGVRCGSPALHHQRLCYFHHRMRLPRPSGAPFPPLEDEASIQYALMVVLQELREKKFDHRTAGLLLYGLQTASFNLRRNCFEPFPEDVVRDDPGDVLQPEPDGASTPDGAPLLARHPKSPNSRRSRRAKSGNTPQPTVIPTIHAAAARPRPCHAECSEASMHSAKSPDPSPNPGDPDDVTEEPPCPPCLHVESPPAASSRRGLRTIHFTGFRGGN